VSPTHPEYQVWRELGVAEKKVAPVAEGAPSRNDANAFGNRFAVPNVAGFTPADRVAPGPNTSVPNDPKYRLLNPSVR